MGGRGQSVPGWGRVSSWGTRSSDKEAVNSTCCYQLLPNGSPVMASGLVPGDQIKPWGGSGGACAEHCLCQPRRAAARPQQSCPGPVGAAAPGWSTGGAAGMEGSGLGPAAERQPRRLRAMAVVVLSLGRARIPTGCLPPSQMGPDPRDRGPVCHLVSRTSPSGC